MIRKVFTDKDDAMPQFKGDIFLLSCRMDFNSFLAAHVTDKRAMVYFSVFSLAI